MRFNLALCVALAATSFACEIHSGAAAGPYDSTPPTAADPPAFEAPSSGSASGSYSPGLDIASVRRVSDETVELRGTGFGASGSVTMDGAPITFVSWTDTVVTIALPSVTAGQHPLVITTGGATSNPVMWISSPSPACDGAGDASAVDDDWTPASDATYVAVSFDGGYASHASGRLLDALDQIGIRATFFVSSALVGAGSMESFADRADRAGLARIAARGHEIGGHTLHETNLLTLDASGARREICDDRAELGRFGFPTRTFAYPAGQSSDAIAAFVKDCGYDGARTESMSAEWPSSSFSLGGTPFGCRDNVDGMKNAIRGLEATGGFTSVVFHDLCDGHCSAGSTSIDDAVSFLAWLKTREQRGTYLRTLGDVVTPAQGH